MATMMIFRPVSREQRLKTLLKPARPASAKPTRS
ncbi:hypothetical protein [Caulobacter sp. 1776]